MHAQRTPLARFIDLSALWSLSLMIWFYVLLARLRQLYPRCCWHAHAAATLGLWALLRRALTSRRRAALPEELVRQLCAHVALMPPHRALDRPGDMAALQRHIPKVHPRWRRARSGLARRRAHHNSAGSGLARCARRHD